jgi:hypothetical protein
MNIKHIFNLKTNQNIVNKKIFKIQNFFLVYKICIFINICILMNSKKK